MGGGVDKIQDEGWEIINIGLYNEGKLV